jgi:quercetin dioxygenase-like cupin family protein
MASSRSSGEAPSGRRPRRRDRRQPDDSSSPDEVVGEADEESFPASDAPGWITQTTIGPPARKPAAGADHPSPSREDPSAHLNPVATMPAPRPKLSEVIDIRSAAPASAGGPSMMLAKTDALEVRRLNLSKGRVIPTHKATREITVHCLEGRIAFTAGGTTRDLGPGQMILLAAGEPHSLVGLEDSTVLVTKVLPASPPGH